MAKKILYLIAEDWALFTHRISLARAAQKAGYKVLIATRVKTHEQAILKEGFKLLPLKHLRRGGINPLKDLKFLLELIKIYFKEKPTLVHHVALKPVLYGTLAAKITGIPHILNALGGLGFLFISHSLKARILKFLVKIGFFCLFKSKKTHLILQNPDDKEALASLISPSQVTLIRGAGVDTKLFYPTPEPLTPPLIATMVSRLLYDKGILELVEAAKVLKQENIPLKIWLCGAPDPENPQSIPLEIIECWQQEGLIEWKGPNEEIARIYQASHIAVLPSYREGLPKALLEAAACGKPIVTTDVPGCREVVDESYNGFLVPLKQIKPLAEALKTLALSPALRQKFGQNSRKRAVEEFSEDLVIEQTLSLYRLLINRV